MVNAVEAPTLVLLHGIGGGGRIWEGLAARLAAHGFSTLALDLPGYGERPAVAALSFAELAADVEAAIDTRDLVRPVLVGHSLGGMVAQTLLRRRPKGYSAAVLACTSPAFGNADGAVQARFLAARLGPLDAGGSMAALAPDLVEAMWGESPDRAGRARAIAVMSTVPPQTYRAAIRCLVTFDERANLPHIGVPILCLAGDRDPNAPSPMMQRMAGKIPGARFACLTGVGHLANLEAPDAFAEAIVDFLHALPRPSV
jgi:3-oxoadipate enol-lactonase